MADLKAQIAITADASGVEAGVNKAKRSLADLGTSTSAAGKKASAGVDGIGAAGEKSSAKLDRATRNIIGSIERTTAALEAGGRNSAKYFEVIAQQRGVSGDVLRPYLAQLDAVTAKQKVAGREIEAAIPSLVRTGISAKQTAAALRGVPAQFTDIAVSLAAGQNPIQVFLQQGGQLKDMFGGIGPAARALGGYVAGLVNPFTIAAAATTLLAVAAHKGSEETTAYAKAIILSGNAAGVTSGQLADMAKRISSVTGTQAAAADAVAQFTANGNVAAKDLERFSLVAVNFARVGGEAVAETVKKFSDLAKSPVAASIKLNETLNYLTLSTYSQIKAMQEQGRQAEAAALAQQTFANAMEGRTAAVEASLGLVERAWRGVKDAAAGTWDTMLGIGRQDSLEQRLAKVAADIEKGRQAFDASAFSGNAEARAQLATNLALQASLTKQVLLQDNVATSAKAAADQVKARIEYDKAGEQFLTDRMKLEREISAARNEGVRAGKSQEDVEKRVALIREKYGKTDANKAREFDRAKLALDLENIQSLNDQRVASFSNAERLIEARRSAGLLDERRYFQEKRGLIEGETRARAEALQAQIDRLSQEKLTGKEKLDNDRKLADATSKLAVLRASSSASLSALSIQEEGSAKRIALSYLTARQAAEDYLSALERQQGRGIESAGQGTQARSFNAGVNQIEDKYENQRRELENVRAQLELEGKFTSEARKQYGVRLALINEFQSKALISYKGYYDKLLQQQGDWSVGASEALNNYVGNAANVAAQTEGLFTRAFQGIEDSLVNLVQTGKADFQSLANSIIADMVRIQARAAISGLLKYFQGAGTASTGAELSTNAGLAIGTFADGGDPPVGRMSIVGERGPEVFVPKVAGTIVPNHKLSQIGGDTTVVNNYNVEAGVSRNEMVSALQLLSRDMDGRMTSRLRAAGVV